MVPDPSASQGKSPECWNLTRKARSVYAKQSMHIANAASSNLGKVPWKVCKQKLVIQEDFMDEERFEVNLFF